MLRIPPHLLQIIIVIEPVLILQLRQSHLVATVLVLHLLEVVLASSYDAHGTATLPRVAHVVT